MQLILALSVIILHHVDCYSRHTVAEQLKLPADTDNNATESLEVKEREREITSILEQFLARRTSEMSSSEQLQKSLAKLTIEPYQGQNTTKTKDPLHWLDAHKKTIAPLAIIVTNLQELTKLQNRDKNSEKKHILEYTEEKSITSNSDPQHLKENPKQTSKEITDSDSNTDLNTNKNSYHTTEDTGADREASFENDFDVNSNDLEDFSFKDDVVSLFNDLTKHDASSHIDAARHSKEETISDKVGDENENKIIQESLEISNDKISQDDLQSYVIEPTYRVKDEVQGNEKNKIIEVFTNETGHFGINQRVDRILDTEDQENLINLLLEDIDGTDLRITKGNEHTESIRGNTSLREGSNITIKVTNDIDEHNMAVSAKEPQRVSGGTNRRGKYKNNHRHLSQNTYTLSFLFNR